ncbi:MAG: formylglycine-generating enzyme family protein [Puniceicoccales bacterium]|jgi:formylglycine-generating enzyme required for sulfatase activity|nr:formylglycine-generating enzyme family protein [Puniceicoccales bacterium]
MSLPKVIFHSVLAAFVAIIGDLQCDTIRAASPSRVPASVAPTASAKPATPATPTASAKSARPATSRRPIVGSPQTLRLPNNVLLEMLPVAAGSFTMGSPSGESEREPLDKGSEAQRRVNITKPYWLGKYEVTQAQWRAVMNRTPSAFPGAQRPVESVKWNEAMDFCKKLTERERAAGRLPAGYRYTLPTEAQWEYACRAGAAGAYGGSGNLNEMGWYAENSGSKTHVVGGKAPNAWGFYDMHGNVWEWCSDRYDATPTGGNDPLGPPTGAYRVNRGGGWADGAQYCRSANRAWGQSGGRNSFFGFRVALSSVGAK